MPPFVYRSLKDFMRVSATAKTRQELLQKLITNAAKRKSQLHIDATGARITAAPETFGMNISKQMMDKQANPLTQMLSPALKNLQGKVVPELLQRLQILAGKGARGVKRYGQRLMGDETLKPLYGRQDEMRALEQQLRQQAGSRIDTKPINQKITLMHDLVDELYGYRKHLKDLDPKKMFDRRMAQGGAEEAAHRRLFPTSNRVLETRAPFSAQQNMRFGLNRARARGSAAMEAENLRRLKGLFGGRLHGMANLHAGQPGFTPGLLDTADSSFRAQLKALADARAHNAQHTDIWREQLPNVFRSQVSADKAIRRELDAIESARAYTVGGASGVTLGGVGYNAYANSGEPAMKKSMTMPQPTSRGTMKKVQMPEASSTKPGCNPEGVQMSNNKQAFMGIGGLAGMATAPEGEEDLSIGRGALRGAGTALGAGAGAGLGAIGGAGIGSIGGGLLGALAGALSKRRFGQTFGQSVGGGMAGGAMAGGGLGYLAGIPAGAIYGGIKGNKATKALLDKSAPIGEKKKKNKEDDKEVKKAAATVLQLLHKNNPQIKAAAPTMEQYQRSGHAGTMSYQDFADEYDDNPSPTPAPAPAPAAPAPAAPAPAAPASPAQPQGGFFSRIGAKADAGVNAAGNAITAPGRALGDAVGSRAAGAYYAGQNAIRNVRRGAQNFGRTVNSYIPSFRSPIHFPNAQQNNMPQ